MRRSRMNPNTCPPKNRMLKFSLYLSMAVLCFSPPRILLAEEPVPISLQREASAASDGGDVYSMEFRDADIKDVLRALGQEAAFNIILSEDVTGRLTLSFHEVKLQDAFQSILKIHHLTSSQDGKIIRVIKSPFPEGEEELQTIMIPINYATAKEIVDAVTQLLSSRGKTSLDIRNNTVILRDIPENLERVKKLVAQMDSETRQVMIEARIVEANTSFARQLGVQWGGSFTDSGSKGTLQLTGGVTRDAVTGTLTPLTGGAGLSGAGFAVNLPADVTQGTGGAIGISFGNVSNTAMLDLQLSAMEDSGNGKILSNPKIMTLNNKEASISSGTQVLIPTVLTAGSSVPSGGGTGSSGGTTGVTEKEATLKLTVTPHITFDNMVLLKIKTKREEFDFNRQVMGIPPKTVKEAETDLMVRDGETIAIGGIYTENNFEGESGVPFLSKIPILGWLFKKENKRANKNELMIFITPRIYKGT